MGKQSYKVDLNASRIERTVVSNIYSAIFPEQKVVQFAKLFSRFVKLFRIHGVGAVSGQGPTPNFFKLFSRQEM